MKKNKRTTEQKKEELLQALKDTYGIVSSACEKANVGRTTCYEWYRDDPEFKQAVDLINQDTGDFVEGALLKRIKEGDTTGIIFYCKTKLKNRGYVEKQEINLGGQQDNPVLVDNKRKNVIQRIVEEKLKKGRDDRTHN
jgi:hypothetical protein